MSIIYSYPIKGAPANNDLILISDSSDSNQTKQVRVSTLPGGSDAGVSFINALDGAVTLTGGSGVTLNTVGNNIEIEAVGSGGTVTEVTTSAPLAVATGTTTPALSITLADTSTDGYLSQGDWNTFNSKTSNTGTVTNVTSTNGAITVASGGTTPALTSVAYSGNTNIGHVPTGSGGSATLYLDGSGNWSTPSGGGSGVTSVTTSDSVYINLTPNAPDTGAITVTAALSAVDGTAVDSDRFLTKDNTWAVPAYSGDTLYSAGTGLSLAGTVFSLASGAALTNLGGGSGSEFLRKDGVWTGIQTAEDLIVSVTHATTRTDTTTPSRWEFPPLSTTSTAFAQIKYDPATANPAAPTNAVACAFARPAIATNYVKVVVKMSILTGNSTSATDERIMIGLHNSISNVQGVNLAYNWQGSGDYDRDDVASGDQIIQMQFTSYILVSDLKLQNGELATSGETVYMYVKGIFDSSSLTAEPFVILGRQWNSNPTTTAGSNEAAGPLSIDVYEVRGTNYTANPEITT